jgi:hypothetical protein
MGTRKVKLAGKAYWARVFAENRDLTGYEDALKDVGGQCTIDVDLNKDNFALLEKSKSMLRGRPSDDNPGHTRVKFKRKWEEQFGGGAPTVVKADGSTWDWDMDGPIGNGSDVEIIIHVYDTSRKSIIGTRLEKVKVVNHVKYEREDDAWEAPKQAEQSKKTTADLDDEIPF